MLQLDRRRMRRRVPRRRGDEPFNGPAAASAVFPAGAGMNRHGASRSADVVFPAGAGMNRWQRVVQCADSRRSPQARG